MMPLFCCQARGLGGSVIMFSRRMAVGGEEDGEWGLVSSGVSCSLVFSGINI